MMAVCFSLLSWGCVTLAVSTFRVPSLQNKSEDCVAVMPIKLSSRYPWIWLLNKTEMIDTKWPVPFHWSLVLFALATNNNWFSLPVGPLHWNPCMNIISHPAPRLSSSLLCATHSSPPVFPFGCDESAAFLHQALFWIGSPTTLFYVDGTFIFFLLIFIHFCTRHGLIKAKCSVHIK